MSNEEIIFCERKNDVLFTAQLAIEALIPDLVF
jgi:hypothetical protein